MKKALTKVGFEKKSNMYRNGKVWIQLINGHT